MLSSTDEKTACKKILEKMGMTGAQVNNPSYEKRKTYDFFQSLDRRRLPSLLIYYMFEILSLLCPSLSLLSLHLLWLQTGKTKVFLRAGQMADLDARRALILSTAAKTIQRKIRTYIARKYFIALHGAAVSMQSICRGLLDTVPLSFSILYSPLSVETL